MEEIKRTSAAVSFLDTFLDTLPSTSDSSYATINTPPLMQSLSLRQRDHKHLWHPLTQHQLQPDSIPIIKAQGVYLIDAEGKEYIDAISSWYTAMYGHCHPAILARVQQQMETLDQIIFAGFTHPIAIELSEKLMAILPANQQKIFFSDNGSTANEVAIKMALQFYHNQGENRRSIVAFENAFHGDTFGAMSVSGLSVYHGPFAGLGLAVEQIPVPNSQNIDSVLATLQSIIDTQSVAAFIYEPLVQGANKMRMYAADHLDQILGLCKANKVLCIADEVMTGFGKLGSHFGTDYTSNKPDIMAISKALTAGLVPMGITTCTQAIYQAFLDKSIDKAFFHAHTYTANPIACAAAVAGMDLLVSEAIQANIKRIIDSHQKFSQQIRAYPLVRSVRQRGTILALDLDLQIDRYGPKRNQIFKYFMDRQVFLRPLGNTIYLVVPYITTPKVLSRIYGVIEDFVKAV